MNTRGVLLQNGEDLRIQSERAFPGRRSGPDNHKRGFRTVPLDEFDDGVIVGSLAALRRKGVENGGFRLLQIGQRQDTPWRFLLLSRSCHWRRPP
jgi:hypothetical protein